jgi:catabolite regulation protein CreA
MMGLRSLIGVLFLGAVSAFRPAGATAKPSLTRVDHAASSTTTRLYSSGNSNHQGWDQVWRPALSTLMAGGLLVSSLMHPLPAVAADSRVVGTLSGSGLVFKDTLQIESFDDPKVKGVTLYISNFQRPITERLTSSFMTDPSYTSVACARTGRVVVADDIGKGKGGEEVFEESRSLLFKTLRVQRIFDEEKKTVVYVSYNTRFDKGDDTNKSRFKSSLCAVGLE